MQFQGRDNLNNTLSFQSSSCHRPLLNHSSRMSFPDQCSLLATQSKMGLSRSTSLVPQMHATDAPTDPRPGCMAETCRHRPLRILRGSYKWAGALSVPLLCDRSLASNASAAKSTRRLHVGPHGEVGGRMAPPTPHPPSLATAALRGHIPKVRAGCLNWARPDPRGGRSVMRNAFGKCLNPWATMIRDLMIGGASVEDTRTLWASSLRDVKQRIRPLFTQERVAASAGQFL